MENFIISVKVIFPIFVYLAIGYSLKCFGIFDKNGADQLNKSVFKLFLPCSLFYNIYTTNIESSVNPKLMVYAASSIFVLVLLLIFIIPKIEKDNKKVGPIIQAIFRSNFAIFGLPVAAMLCGEGELGAVSLLIAVIVPVFNILTVVVMEMFRSGKIDLKKIIIGIISNPLIISSTLGIILSILKIEIYDSVSSIISTLGDTSTPLALIALGATFSFSSIKGYKKQIAIGLIGRLILVPLIFLSFAIVMGFRHGELIALLTMYSSPVAVSSFIMAKQMDADHVLAGHYVVLSAVISIFTVFMWILILKNMMFI